MTRHEPREGTTKPGEPRDPANTPTTDEKALLTALLALDTSIRAAGPHIGQQPGAGLGALLRRIITMDTGISLS